jgi:cell surface protein SprA
VMRMAQMQLVANQWRVYNAAVDSSGNLRDKGLSEAKEPYDPKFTVGTVSIERNSSGNGITSPYVIPPGTIRDQDVTVSNRPQLNEQSLRLCVSELQDGDARAVFKNVNLDLINYENFRLFVHAESENSFTRDNDARAFIRIGTDFQDNYYEIELPLKLSRQGINRLEAEANPELVWLPDNKFDFPYRALVDTKVERNRSNGGINNDSRIILPYSRQFDKYRITVVGNPDLSAVQTIMIGIRNPQTPDRGAKTLCMWVDEMSNDGFNSTSGDAAVARLSTKLADFATLTASFRMVRFGFGSIQQKIWERARENTRSFDISMAVNLEKMLPAKWNLKVPVYLNYSDDVIAPRFNPLDKDVFLDDAISTFSDGDRKTSFKQIVQDRTVKRGINFTNVQKLKNPNQTRSLPWDLSNFSFTYAYADIKRTNVNTQLYLQQNYRGSVGYNYTSTAKPLEPFKNVKFLDSPYLKLIKDFNINFIPTSISVRGDLDRRFIKTQLRNELLTTNGILPQFEKYFTFTRQYDVRWTLTKAINLDYSATAFSVIDEPAGELNTPEKRDSVWKNVQRLGRMKRFDQRGSATYRLPLDKLPFTNWIAADIRYGATYNWTAGSVGISDTLGNLIQNSQNRDLNSRLDMTKLYNKIKFLKEINEAPPPNPNKKKPAKDTSRIRLGGVSLKKDTTKKAELKLLKGLLRAVMSVRNITFTYSLSEQTQLAGFKPVAGFFGLSDGSAPGIPFILGSQSPDIRQQAVKNGWLVNSPYLNTPFQQSATEEITGGALIEPFRDFKITVTAKRSKTSNFSDVFRAQLDSNTNNRIFVLNPRTGLYEGLSPYRQGSFSMSFIALKTAFIKNDSLNSPVFNNFVNYQNTIQQRLQADNPNGGKYDVNSQDVLIAAFVAAYSGRDPNSQKLSPFYDFPLPNWNLNYSGLSKIPALKNLFSSVTLTHGYTSSYNVGNFISSLDYGSSVVNPYNLLGSNYQQPTLINIGTGANGQYLPVLVFNQIVISERFTPLIGVNLRTVSKVTINVQYNRERNIGLNLANAQVTELASKDLIVGLGYTANKLRLPFRINGEVRTLKNEIAFRCDFTLRDSRTFQRKIGEPATVTSGNYNIQFRPTVNYTLNQRLNIQAYFERQINDPRVSTSFRRTNTNFGIQLRVNLTQ